MLEATDGFWTLTSDPGLRHLDCHHTPSGDRGEEKTSGRGWYTGRHDGIWVLTFEQALIRAVSPTSGRVLIYVWAVEQDELSKRHIPIEQTANVGVDVFVPWVLSNKTKSPSDAPSWQVVWRRFPPFPIPSFSASFRHPPDKARRSVHQPQDKQSNIDI